MSDIFCRGLQNGNSDSISSPGNQSHENGATPSKTSVISPVNVKAANENHIRSEENELKRL